MSKDDFELITVVGQGSFAKVCRNVLGSGRYQGLCPAAGDASAIEASTSWHICDESAQEDHGVHTRGGRGACCFEASGASWERRQCISSLVTVGKQTA